MTNLKFTVDSALLRKLGEKLVETVHLALIELVKNSYDADATKVTILFTENEYGESEIQIMDDGIGMSFETVNLYWMRIATTNKTLNKYSPLYGRPKTGAKGIGRFSCRRLGSKLKLISIGHEDGKTKEGDTQFQKTEVEFSWTDFIPGTNVTEIECPGSQEEIENVKTGTKLVINGIDNNEWTTRGLYWLKRQLAVLAANRGVRRKGFIEDPGFNIVLIAPDIKGGISDIRSDLIKGGWGTLKAKVNEKHQAVCELEAKTIGSKTITSTKVFKNLRNIELELGILIDERQHLRDTAILSIGTLNQILPEWGGVQVRYHGFRVYPYGDDDWLDIDRDRGLRRGTPKEELYVFAQSLRGVEPGRALLNQLSMRSYVGNVEIGPSATGFEMKSNREGFISSPAINELKEFVRFAVDWSTIYYDFYLRNKLKEESETARQTFEDVTEEKIIPEKIVNTAINYIKKEVKNITRTLPLLERHEVEFSIEKATEAIQKHDESNKEELSHLRLIASTSTLLLIFSHEVKSLLGLLEQSNNALALIENKLSAFDQKPVLQLRHEIFDMKERFEELLELTSLIGVDSRKTKPERIALKERIIRAVDVFKLITNKYKVKIDYSAVSNNAVVKKILEAELYAVLLNALSNSIKSVIAVDGERKIQIVTKRSDAKILISIRDTGVGIDPQYFNDVFIPFIADPDNRLYDSLSQYLNPEDKYIVGTGSGLGLSIIHEIVKVRNGSVRFRKPEDGWSTELEIILP